MSESLNVRAKEMWSIIREYEDIDFYGADVVDLGFGYGDLLTFSLIAGASFVTGVDKNSASINITSRKIEDIGKRGVAILELGEISDFIVRSTDYFDIAFCTSVLPYLDDPDSVLLWMREYAGISIIECQYAGDGPGFEHIRDDYDMGVWLEKYWEFAHPIGKTELAIRDASRTIWLCYNI